MKYDANGVTGNPATGSKCDVRAGLMKLWHINYPLSTAGYRDLRWTVVVVAYVLHAYYRCKTMGVFVVSAVQGRPGIAVTYVRVRYTADGHFVPNAGEKPAIIGRPAGISRRIIRVEKIFTYTPVCRPRVGKRVRKPETEKRTIQEIRFVFTNWWPKRYTETNGEKSPSFVAIIRYAYAAISISTEYKSKNVYMCIYLFVPYYKLILNWQIFNLKVDTNLTQ